MKPTMWILLTVAAALTMPVAARAEESMDVTSTRARLAGEERPALFVSTEVLELEIKAGQTAEPRFFRVSGTRAGLAYSVSIAGAEWLEFDAATGRTSVEGDPVAVRVNAAKLQPGSYDGVLRVTTWRGSEPPAVLVKLKVTAIGDR